MAALSPLLGGQATGSNHHRNHNHNHNHNQNLCEDIRLWGGITRKTSQRIAKNREQGSYVRVYATQSAETNPNPRQRAPPGVDTRIHWNNEEEGWIGGGNKTKSSSNQSAKEQFNKTESERTKEILGEKFSELLNNSTDSHYQFLGVSAQADLEEIKAAYRRLSKEYHPDTTSLPLKEASNMFMKLRDVYETLSDDEKRRFYDWTLAQEAASREAERMRMKLDDPYMQEIENFESIPDMVDRLGGRNMELSDQTKSALTFDIFAIIFTICCITIAAFFKEPY